MTDRANHMQCGVCKKERPALDTTYIVIGAVGRLHAPNSYMFCPDCFAEMAGVEWVERLTVGASKAISNETLMCDTCETIFIEHIRYEFLGTQCPRLARGCEGSLIAVSEGWKHKSGTVLTMEDFAIYLDDSDEP